jgi:hypothetical protein
LSSPAGERIMSRRCGAAGAAMQSRHSRRTEGTRAISIVMVLTLALCAASCRALSAQLPSRVRGAALADRFAAEFWSSNDDDALDRLLSYRLRTIMRTNQLRAVRDGLTRDQGPVRSIGPAWYEDRFIDYLRFRVPIEFSRTTVDMRVVVDGEQISQFFIVDHIPPP